jgi:hypothetical protein
MVEISGSQECDLELLCWSAKLDRIGIRRGQRIPGRGGLLLFQAAIEPAPPRTDEHVEWYGNLEYRLSQVMRGEIAVIDLAEVADRSDLRFFTPFIPLAPRPPAP